ncbi:DMT family transporter [Caviibacter abscessus]|uniref:DMT family transporter n=1 Tax=Caviibacter abscessus TaxID=1766719 RepID=UPI0008331D44|nr:EamA family transporter [Caviibacter abscessus]
MNNRTKGLILSIFSASLWGIGGNFTQYIFAHSTFTYMPLVTIRMFLTGIIVLLIGIYLEGFDKAKKMLQDRNTRLKLYIYSVFGMIGVQVPFFATIQYSSAPFATLIQFSTPLIIMIYISLRTKKMPTNNEIASTLTILAGVFLVVTNGNLETLIVDKKAILWGITTACGFAFYLLYAKEFFSWPTTFTMGYGMLLGSIELFIFLPNKNIFIHFTDIKVILAFLFMVIFGTIIPFYFFVESIRYISAKLTSILSVAEPIVSLFVAVIFFKDVFGIIQLIGVFLVIVSVLIIGLFAKE